MLMDRVCVHTHVLFYRPMRRTLHHTLFCSFCQEGKLVRHTGQVSIPDRILTAPCFLPKNPPIRRHPERIFRENRGLLKQHAVPEEWRPIRIGAKKKEKQKNPDSVRNQG